MPFGRTEAVDGNSLGQLRDKISDVAQHRSTRGEGIDFVTRASGDRLEIDRNLLLPNLKTAHGIFEDASSALRKQQE
jgi:hypothetical protein